MFGPGKMQAEPDPVEVGRTIQVKYFGDDAVKWRDYSGTWHTVDIDPETGAGTIQAPLRPGLILISDRKAPDSSETFVSVVDAKPMITSRSLLLWSMLGATLFANPAPAQSFAVVPARYAQQESRAIGMVAGFDERRRMQVLVHASHLTAIRGPIQAIWFRRDVNSNKSYQAGTAALRVSMSAARRASWSPSKRFDDNAGPDRTVLFQGKLALPSSAGATAPVPWDARHSVRIPLGSGYRYVQGSNLCIEIEGGPVDPPPRFFWSVDYDYDVTFGTVRRYGTACGAVTKTTKEPADAHVAQLIVGNTLRLRSFGRPQTPAFLIVGTRQADFPLDPIGAPGCRAYVTPDAIFASRHAAARPYHRFPEAHVEFLIPRTPSLLAGRFFVQWANMETGQKSNPAGLAMTNGVELRIAPRLPPGKMSTVMSREVRPNEPFPGEGHVRVSRGPVIRFEYGTD